MKGYQVNKSYWYGTVGCIFLMVLGVVAIIFRMMDAQSFSHLSRLFPWGVIVAVFTVFLSLAIGCSLLGAMSRVYGLKGLRPLAPLAVFLSIICLVGSFILLMVMVENPWRLLIYNAVFPSLRSNLWWLVTLSGITAGCAFLEFATMMNMGNRSKFIFGFMAAVTGVGASNNLAALVTGSMDPPLWFGAQLLVLYLLSSVLAGVAAVVGATLLLCLVNGRRVNKIERSAIQISGTVMQYLCLILLGLYGIRFGTIFFRPSDPGYSSALQLLTGSDLVLFAVFGVVLGLVVPLVFFWREKWEDIRSMTAVCALVIIGLFFQRYGMLIAGQSVPKLGEWVMAGQPNGYFPSLSEAVVVLGVLGLVGVFLLVGDRVFGKLLRSASHPARKPR